MGFLIGVLTFGFGIWPSAILNGFNYLTSGELQFARNRIPSLTCAGRITLMKRTFVVSTLLACGMALSACASVTRGTTETVMIYASPDGAQIGTSIGLTCNTSPCSLEVSRKTKFAVTVSKEGYKTQTVQVTTAVAPGGVAGMAGNVLVGGVIGVGIDAASGATLDHKPNPVLVELVPLNPKNPKTPKGDLSQVREQIAAKQREQEAAAMRKTGGV
ncbi:MAG: translation initiation factor 2 [Pseudomonadota bacterium]